MGVKSVFHTEITKFLGDGCSYRRGEVKRREKGKD